MNQKEKDTVMDRFALALRRQWILSLYVDIATCFMPGWDWDYPRKKD